MELQSSIIYGPISSRRLKKSLGVNLYRDKIKICNFNCVYCQYGRTERYYKTDDIGNCLTVEEITDEVAKFIAGIGEPRSYIDYITISGNGEPTLHPYFTDIVDSLITIRDEMVPNIPIALLSNGSMLYKDELKKAVSKLDFPIIKLDVGDSDSFKKINRPAEWIEFDKIMKSFKEIGDFTIQSLFFHSNDVDNMSEDNITNWLKILKEIRPNLIQIYTIDRSTSEIGIKPASRDELVRIIDRVKNEAYINAILY
ncbi:MAG: radical SAM protein [bacterium]